MLRVVVSEVFGEDGVFQHISDFESFTYVPHFSVERLIGSMIFSNFALTKQIFPGIQ